MDAVLVDWLLEQLIDDVNASEESIQTSAWSGPLWLWCVLFGAAIAGSGKAANAVEKKQLDGWVVVYDEKIKVVSQALGLDSWQSVRSLLGGFVRTEVEVDTGLREIWERALTSSHQAGLSEADTNTLQNLSIEK